MFTNSNKYSKYVIAFIASAFTLIQGVDFVLLKIGVEINYMPTLLVLLLIAFFVGLFIVWYNQKTSETSSKVVKKPRKSWTLYLNIFVTLLLGALFVYYFQKGNSAKTLLDEKLPEIVAAFDNDQFEVVYKETKQLIDEGNTNPVVQSYYDKVTVPVSITTFPEGVAISFKYVRDSLNQWANLGTSPLDNIRVPNSFLEYKFSYQGIEETEVRHTYYVKNGLNYFILPTSDSIPQDHKLCLGGTKPLSYPGIDHLPPIIIAPYSISKYEVTNEAYKAFVDAGGYENPDFWNFPYEMNGRVLTFENTVPLFVDAFGKLGPANWSFGNYPEGQGSYPVTGISWFEAMAYANFKGLSLPNLYQWANAATLSSAASFVPKSNFSKNQLIAVGSMDNKNDNDLYDIAGNAREWILNSIEETNTKKGILGGGFNDDAYYFNDYYGQNALDRSISNGMRLVKNLESAATYETDPTGIVSIGKRDFLKEEKISEDVFEIFKEQFDYPQKPLKATTSLSELTSGSFRAERFEITSPYEKGGILPGYIFYDSAHVKPLKPIIFFPGSNAIHLTNMDYAIKRYFKSFDYLMSEGYAVVLPIYLSTYEREDELKSDYPNESEMYKEHVIKWGKEYKRTIDYIQSRKDMDATHLSYYGVSWGGYMANILLAIDDRVKSATLYVAGLCFQKSKKEVESYHYTSRIAIPVLMLNGEFDQFFPLETSQIPMFKLLATPDEDKKHYVAKTGHYVPNDVLIEEHLGWLKKYENE
jgi:eukaryotic-like serine/threonine-protein kinase